MPDTSDPNGGLSAKQLAFLSAFLGVEPTAAAPVPAVLGLWMGAKQTTGDQLNELQNHLKNSGLGLFERIADKGLHGITSGQLTAMQVALSELDKSNGAAGAVRKARTAIADMRAFLTTNEVLAILERNPFDIPVSIRATLGNALGEIEKQLPKDSGA
ncbi:MAG: hypothetical protein AB8B51_04160 [Sedimentitalea sp.]